MAAEVNDSIAASLAEMEYLISGLTESDATEWRFVNPGSVTDAVIGATEAIARYQSSYPQRLRVAQWLGPDAFDGEVGYDVCHFRAGQLLLWRAGARELASVKCWDIAYDQEIEPQAAHILGLVKLLRIAEPVPSPLPLSREILLERLALTQAYAEQYLDDDPA